MERLESQYFAKLVIKTSPRFLAFIKSILNFLCSCLDQAVIFVIYRICLFSTQKSLMVSQS